MVNFSYYNPTQIEFGKEKEKNIGKHIAQSGIKKVLICYGSERIKKNGLFEIVLDSLQSNNIEFCELGGIVSNPILSKVYEGIEIARANGVEAILSIGGGSVLDSAKTIAVGSLYNGDVWDFFEAKAVIKDALAIFDIMTLSATGSEMNGYAVITNDTTKQKYHIYSPYIYPKVSIINPDLTKSVPNNYLAYSAVDIIAHVIEAYFTAKIQPNFQSRLVESIVNTVIETTEILLKEPNNYDARAEFSWASTQALNGITTAGSGLFNFPNHMIEHSISALFNIPHGAGLSIVIPAWMRWFKSQNESQFERFAKNIFNSNSAIESLEQWFDKIGSPIRLSQVNISSDEIESIIDNIVPSAKLAQLDNIYTKEVLREILNYAR